MSLKDDIFTYRTLVHAVAGAAVSGNFVIGYNASYTSVNINLRIAPTRTHFNYNDKQNHSFFEILISSCSVSRNR
jgi:hypothetical protein